MKLTTDELVIFEILVIQNRDSKRLQGFTGLDYTNSISLLNKLRKILGR